MRLTALVLGTLVQACIASFNPLEHLAGNAPAFHPEQPPLQTAPPRGCTVNRAAYIVRHAAIYGNDFDYETYIQPFVEKLKNTSADWSADLKFLGDWTAPMEEEDLEKITRSGVREAVSLGVEVQERYPSLRVPQTVWSSSADRTVKSAHGFVVGFTGDESDQVNITVVDEAKDTGADSLTPYKACPAYSSSYGSDQSRVFMEKYTKPIVARLNATAPAFNFTLEDVVGMFQLCGYETVIRGSSPFCSLDLFSADEWLSFEYGEDIRYFHNSGYGRPLTTRLGIPWVKASVEALSDRNSSQDLYVSFTHREVPPMVVTALGLYNNSAFSGSNDVNATMPTDRINYNRAWKSSEILPFLTNIAIEQMTCGDNYYPSGEYYRVLVNSSPQPLTECRNGPGDSCHAEDFEDFIQDRVERFGDFAERCGLKDAAQELTIYEN